MSGSDSDREEEEEVDEPRPRRFVDSVAQALLGGVSVCIFVYVMVPLMLLAIPLLMVQWSRMSDEETRDIINHIPEMMNIIWETILFGKA